MSDGDELQIDTRAQPPPVPIADQSVFQHAAPHPNSPASAAPATNASALAPLPTDLQAYLDQQEREILIRALRETGFNRTATAARLGISLRQIRYRIARLNIAVPHGGEPEDLADV